MTISWLGTLSITDAGGHLQTVDAPRNGGNAKLQGIGRGFGAIKLVTDPPHWSDNGH